MAKPPKSPELIELERERADLADKIFEQKPILEADDKRIPNFVHRALVVQYNNVNQKIWVMKGHPAESYVQQKDDRSNISHEQSAIGDKTVKTTRFVLYPSKTVINFRQSAKGLSADKSMRNEFRRETGSIRGDQVSHRKPAVDGADLTDSKNVANQHGPMQQYGTWADFERGLRQWTETHQKQLAVEYQDHYRPGENRPYKTAVIIQDREGNYPFGQNVTFSNPENQLGHGEKMVKAPNGNVAILHPGKLRLVAPSSGNSPSGSEQSVRAPGNNSADLDRSHSVSAPTMQPDGAKVVPFQPPGPSSPPLGPSPSNGGPSLPGPQSLSGGASGPTPAPQGFSGPGKGR